MDAKEEWAPVPGFESRYKVSRSGKVWSEVSGQLLTPYLNPNMKGQDYFRVDLRGEGEKRRQPYVHHLVLEAFDEERPTPGHHAHHIDGDPHNNQASNLEWVNGSDHVAEHNGSAEKPEKSAFSPEESAPF